MILIPYGHEHTTVRRLPWVTFTIMGLCLLVFIFTTVSSDDSQGVVVENLGDFFEYLASHPYLDIDPRLEEILFENVPEEQFRSYLEALKEFGGQPPASRRQIEAEQDRLDGIVDQILASMEAMKDSVYHRWGMVPSKMRPHTLITYQFLHGGFWHLFGNMLFLFLAGPFVEDVFGRPIFATVYLASGAVSAFMFGIRYSDTDSPLIGASGAVAGVMGAFLIRYLKTKIRFFYFFFPFWSGTFMAPAWLMLPLWFLRELVFAQAMDVIAPNSGGGGVAHWAHVWGFVFGIAAAGTIKYFRVEERFIHQSIESKITLLENPVVERAIAATSDGRPEVALNMLAAELKKNPGNVDAAVAMWNVARNSGEAAKAAPFMVEVMQHAVRSNDPELVVTHWQDLIHAVPDLTVAPALAVRLAEILDREGRHEGAEITIELAQRQLSSDTPTALRIRLARLAVAARAPNAASLVAGALEQPDLPDDVRSELDGLVVTPVGSETEEQSEMEIEPLAISAPRRHSLQLIEAVPKRFDGEVLLIEVNQQPRRMGLAKIQAVGVGGIRPEGERSYLIVDLLLDPPWGDSETLRVVRLMSTDFDPRRLVAASSPMEAFQKLVETVLETSEAVPLPDPESARGRPFRSFASLQEYEAEVLGVVQ